MTAALPTDLVERVLHVMRAEADGGRSVIYISHRLQEVRNVARRITVFRNGATVAEGFFQFGERANDAMRRFVEHDRAQLAAQ